MEGFNSRFNVGGGIMEAEVIKFLKELIGPVNLINTSILIIIGFFIVNYIKQGRDDIAYLKQKVEDIDSKKIDKEVIEKKIEKMEKDCEDRHDRAEKRSNKNFETFIDVYKQVSTSIDKFQEMIVGRDKTFITKDYCDLCKTKHVEDIKQM